MFEEKLIAKFKENGYDLRISGSTSFLSGKTPQIAYIHVLRITDSRGEVRKVSIPDSYIHLLLRKKNLDEAIDLLYTQVISKFI